MEIELDLRGEKAYLWQVLIAAVIVLVLIGLAMIGSRVTPLTLDGTSKVMSWSDWRLLQAEKEYHAELEVLLKDADQLAVMLESRPSPVAAQILAERISKHTRSGDVSLAPAREALLISALNIRDWAAGTLDRDTAVQSLKMTLDFLQQ